MSLTTASGLVSLLDDKVPDVKAFALKKLVDIVDEFWAEISESVNKIEILQEDASFEHNKLAAILASKVYYHLSEYEDALHFALCAEELFDLNQASEYVETIISKCIDKYTELRVAQDQALDSGAALPKFDYTGDRTWAPNSSTYKRLEHVVDRMFERCFEHKQYKQALGISIEARRFDIFEKALSLADDREGILRYAFRAVLTLIDSVRLRNRLLQILVSVFMSHPSPADSINVCQCLVLINEPKVIELHLQFLIRNNKADLRLLERIREEVRHSVTHNATVLANGIMHCGTTSDQFLRDHLSWLGKAVNWAKFTATATLGVIHKGHEKDALRLMSAYLPKDASGSSGSVYTEGGGLFALGLIHATHGSSMTEYLLNQLKEAAAEPVRHGACLGLGLAAMGTGREDVYDQMKLNLYQDDAITGEAAGIGIGLVMLGTGSPQAIEDLLGYAKETAHEKIIRGIALGIAMVMYGRLEEADELIDRLIVDNDPILRWSGMATIAMAYCGTGHNRAVQRLLHVAVSDTNDDVRRWAVTALGFVLFKTPDQVPALVSLLTESYHPHLRFGAAMAMGVACAGTALKEAVGLLETLYEGTVPFVRQGALVATAMVLMLQNGVTCPKSVEFREKCLKIITDRHEDLLAKFGAILACGILDAGGCNMTISLQTRTGNDNMAAAVGLLLFQNFWFWYPLTNFISLALTPTTLIALNKDLKMPKMQFRSNAKPSTFAYPQPLQPEKEKKREKVETAILSITAKQRKKEADRKHKEQQQKSKEAPKEEKMDVDTVPPEVTKEEKPDEKEEKEPSFVMLNNPARVLRAQQRVISIPENSRYYTLKPVTQAGILMVHDRRPHDTEVLVELVHGHGPTGDRTIVSSSASASGAAAGGSSDVTAAVSSGLAEPGVKPIHASTIGAYLGEDDEEEEGVDEDEEEDSSSDVHEEEDEEEDDEEDVAIATVVAQELSDKADVEMGEASVSLPVSSKREKHKVPGSGRSGKSSAGSGAEPAPPEPFLYIEEGATPPVSQTAAATSSAILPASASDPLPHEPMEVETIKEKQNDESANEEDKQDKKDDNS
ncbi:unnamed protein product [Dicrocoelium dendriticum]|nr:unnamed protein product [Dicrocoelium dendriticum]